MLVRAVYARALVISALIALSTSGASCSQLARQNIAVIGVSLPVAGSEGSDGLEALHAIELALDQANASPPEGLRWTIELRDTSRRGFVNPHEDEGRDTTLDAPHGADDLRAFAANPRIVAVLGPMTSDVARAEIPVATRAGLALVSASAREADLTAQPSTFFRLCPSRDDDSEAAAMAARWLGARGAFVVDDAEPHGARLANLFARWFARDDGVVLGRLSVRDAPSFQLLRARLAAVRPDLVAFGGPDPTNVLLVPPSAVSSVLDPRRVALMGDPGYLAPLAARYSTIWEADLPDTAEAARFKRVYRARYGDAPRRVAAYYYAATQYLTRAIESAYEDDGGFPSRSDVIAALRKQRALQTLVGPIAFTALGDLRRARLSLVRIAGTSYQRIRDIVVSR